MNRLKKEILHHLYCLNKGLQYIKNDKGKDYELFDSIYAMLLKAFIIKSGGKRKIGKR